VILLFYALVLGGAALLVLDVTGHLGVPPGRVWPWRRVALVAAGGPGLAPLLVWLTDRLGVGWPYPAVASGYFLAFLIFAAGVVDWRDRRRASIWLRRAGYLGLLALAAIPSWVLLVLTPLVFVAGAGLVRARVEPEGSQ